MSVEQQPNSTESSAEYESANERREQLENGSNGPEKSPQDSEKKVEEAHEALESIQHTAEKASGATERKKPSNRSKSPLNHEQSKQQFNKTMRDIRAELSPTSKTFSKVIHAQGVEKASELVGATVARPNAILAGAITAFFLTLVVYVVAKVIGYQLSGFETIGAFIIGWVIGIVYDYVRLAVTGKH